MKGEDKPTWEEWKCKGSNYKGAGVFRALHGGITSKQLARNPRLIKRAYKPVVDLVVVCAADHERLLLLTGSSVRDMRGTNGGITWLRDGKAGSNPMEEVKPRDIASIRSTRGRRRWKRRWKWSLVEVGEGEEEEQLKRSK